MDESNLAATEQELNTKLGCIVHSLHLDLSTAGVVKIVGKIAVNGLLKGKAEIIPGFTNKLNAYLPKFFPKTFVERIAGNIYETKKVDKMIERKTVFIT